MKRTTMWGLVLAAVLTTMVLFGSGTASAVVLCEENKDPCPEAKTLPNGTVVKAENNAPGNITLTTNTTSVECESKWTATTTADTHGEITGGEVSAFTMTPCSQVAGPACGAGVAATANLPYSLDVASSGSGNGEVAFFLGKGKGQPAITVVCGKLDCTFTFAEMPFEVAGGTGAIAEVNAGATKMEGKACPAFGVLGGEYKVTNPPKVFIAATTAPPVLCKSNTVPCPATEIWPLGTAFTASLGANLKFNYVFNGTKKEPSCTASSVNGKTTGTGRPYIGQITKWEFSNCGGGVCEISAQHLPYKFEIEESGGGNGTLTWRNETNGQPAVKIKCGGLFEECIYGTTYFGFELEGGAPNARFYWPTKVALARESGSSLLCSETATWEGTGSEEVKYKITSPAPLFVHT
jgi:hypothetical protein